MFLIPQDYYVIKNTAKKGRGVFAKKEIAAGTIIGDYLGKFVRSSEEENYEKRYGLYLMAFNDAASLFPDLETKGVHLLNHSCMPNCDNFDYQEHIVFFALRRIFPGEELTYSYNLSPLAEKEPANHPCNCQTPLCHGNLSSPNQIIDQKIIEFSRKQAAKNKRHVKIKYGEYLKPLKHYPARHLSNNSIYDIFGNFHKAPLALDDKIMPKSLEIKNKIRQSGRVLKFKNLNIKVFGFFDGFLITKLIR
ncbi:MAG: SET domain-containing protein-lysine N-methyltransferase [Patescibacteria group bacterium]|nr:SET domain-containing protein-lysine N-methyltransferase [Patescibacteria group bacterium]MDD4610549.1 SET domain-containing protein-lysine N-methyltransferase [Patescibacteria group bacterium]